MHVLQQQIASLRRSFIWQRRLRAVCWMLTAAVGVAILLGAVDYWLHVKDVGLRLLSTFVLVLVVAWVAFRTWYLPARFALRPLEVARRVESHFPQLQDSLASAIEFLDQSEDDLLGGSAQLRRLVVTRAQEAVKGLPLTEVIDRRPLRRALIAFGSVALLALVCIVFDSAAVRVALARLISPLGSAQWPRQHHLAFREVPARLAAGQSFEVELIDSAGPPPDDVRIQFAVDRNESREVTSEPMRRTGDVLVARRDNIQQSFEFRAEGGDDDTMPWHRVEVVEAPKLESLKFTVHPPAYSGLPSTAGDEHLEVLADSGIEVSGVTDQSIRSARIVQAGLPPVDAEVSMAGEGKNRSFYISPTQWIPTKSGTYRLELTDSDGVVGSAGAWNLRVNPDPPPSVTWQEPADDMYVLPSAAIDIDVAVKDNLAIKQVDLKYERQRTAGSEQTNAVPEPQITLYRGPEKALPIHENAAGGGESRTIQYEWDLVPLQLPVGAQITMTAEAQDYRPGTGRTTGPRRVTIIDATKLEARLTDRQTQIVRQLERSLAIEQKTRDDVRQLEIEQRDTGGLSQPSRSALQTMELNQRRVGRMIADPAEGIPPLIEAFLREIAINRLETSTVREPMERLAGETRRLASQPLSIADRELTTARKSLDDAHAAEVVTQSLANAATAQDDVVATLERLVSEFSGKSDARKFAQQLAELRQDQLAHEKSSRDEIGVDTLPLTSNELSPSQRAVLNKAAAGQESLAARFSRIEQGLDQLAQRPSGQDDSSAAAVSEAVAIARQQHIELEMRQTTDDLRANRVGLALDREQQIAESLQRMLDALRNEQERKPEQLAEKLRDAEQRLAKLREQTAGLRQQIASTESKPSAPKESTEALVKRQQETKDAIERLAKELNRLQASEASKSTQSAAEKLANSSTNPNGKSNTSKAPSPSSQVQKAEQDLKSAAEQLAERRQQAEDDLALEIVRRFQAELAEMVKRQRQVIDDTSALSSSRSDNPSSAERDKKIASLGNEERQLADLAKDHGELLFGLEAVRISLEDAEKRLRAAGAMLEARETDQSILEAERLALMRLETLLQAFAQTATEAAPQQNAAPPSAAGGQNNATAPQRRPTFELLQAKMLRAMQADLNERTEQFQQRIATAAAADRANLQQEAQHLAAEQAQLAELVESMIKRDNEARQQPPGN